MKTLDQKYPLTKGIKLNEKKERFENFGNFFNLLVDDFPQFLVL
ncbi:hypothetical protein AAAQ13_00365 (plasmid) [Lactococcus lactis subsp. lactis]